MSFLSLNGITFPVRIDGARVLPSEEIGEMGRSFGGTLRRSRQALKAGYEFDSTPMIASEARAWRSLVLGEGSVWSFEGQHLYSSKGATFDSVTGTPTFSTTAKFGTRSMQLSEAIGVRIQIATPLTVLCWHQVGGTWVHRIYTNDGTTEGGWVDGVAGSSLSEDDGFFYDGDLLLGADAGALAGTYRYDDLVILPFVIPGDWAAELEAVGAAFPDLPKLSASGDVIDGTLEVMAEVEASPTFTGNIDGVRHNNLQTLSLRIREV